MIVQSFSIKKRRATANAVALLLVRMMGLDKLLLRKILMLCSALGGKSFFSLNKKQSPPRLHSQTSPAKNGSQNRFINAVVRFGSPPF